MSDDFDNIPDVAYAFPWTVSSGDKTKFVPGMTLRDYFAGQALSYCLKTCRSELNLHGAAPGYDLIARRSSAMAYEIASAMLAERERAK